MIEGLFCRYLFVVMTFCSLSIGCSKSPEDLARESYLTGWRNLEKCSPEYLSGLNKLGRKQHEAENKFLSKDEADSVGAEYGVPLFKEIAVSGDIAFGLACAEYREHGIRLTDIVVRDVTLRDDSPEFADVVVTIEGRQITEMMWLENGSWKHGDLLIGIFNSERRTEVRMKIIRGLIDRQLEEVKHRIAQEVIQKVLRDAPTDTVGIPPVPVDAATPVLRVIGWRAHMSTTAAFVLVEGEVQNVSGRSLRDVLAVATVLGSDGGFITYEDSLIDYNPILDKQVSPFKVRVRYNPAMRNVRLAFKELMGGALQSVGNEIQVAIQ